MIQGALHQGLRGGGAVLCQDVLFQGAGIDPNADGDFFLAAGVSHSLYPAFVPDVAGVDTNLVNPGSYAFQSQAVVKMDVRHQRNAHPFLDGGDQSHGLLVGDCRPQNLTAGLLQAQGLGHATLSVRGGYIEHGLHRDGRAAANGDVPRQYLF